MSLPEPDVTETLDRKPLLWRDVVFWVDDSSRSLQTYPPPISKWNFNLHQLDDEWLLEVYAYGQTVPASILNQQDVLRSAGFAELCAAMAVLSHEGVDPKIFEHSTHPEMVRLHTRWSSWLRHAPEWVSELESRWK